MDPQNRGGMAGCSRASCHGPAAQRLSRCHGGLEQHGGSRRHSGGAAARAQPRGHQGPYPLGQHVGNQRHHRGMEGKTPQKNSSGWARSLTTTPHLKVHFHWVKGHAGAEGNERADKLADKGKATQQKYGTNAGVPEITNAADTSRAGQGWTEAMHEAAKQTFRKAKTIRAKPWISDLTLEALTSARKAEAEGLPEAKAKRNKAKRLARKDKIKWVHDQLTSDPSGEAHAMWKTVRRQRMGFREKKQHLVVDERPIPLSKTHEAFKTHLETKQWAPHTATPESLEVLRERTPLRPQRQDGRIGGSLGEAQEE